MSAHSIRNERGLHYLTLTTVGWIDLFTKKSFRDIILSSLRYCQAHKGLVLFAYVIMSNHLHLIAHAEENYRLSDILKDFKRFTSTKIRRLIEEKHTPEREWLLHVMHYYAKFNHNNSDYQLWQRGNHPVELFSLPFLRQKLNYIHQNPVRAGIVAQPEHYLFSSARDYLGEEGEIPITLLDLAGCDVGAIW